MTSDRAVLSPAMPPVGQGDTPPALYEALPDADLVRTDARLHPSRPFHWLARPGDTLMLHVWTPAADGVVSGRLTAWDWRNRPVWTQRVPARSLQSIPFYSAHRGAWMITLDGLRADQSTAWRMTRSVAFAPDQRRLQSIWRTMEFQVGSCCFPDRQRWPTSYGPGCPDDMDPELAWRLDADLMACSGLGLTRIDLLASDRAEDGYVNTRRMDEITEYYRRQGLRLLLQIWGPGEVLPHYKAEQPAWRYPRALQPLRTHVRTGVRRYARLCHAVEVWNEPDNLDFWLGTVEEYGIQTRAVLEEIARTAPRAETWVSGFCRMKPEWTAPMMREIAHRAHGVSYHAHGDRAQLRAVRDAIRRDLETAGWRDALLHNTEMGWACWRLDQDRMQAATGIQKLLDCWASGDRSAWLYCSRSYVGPRLATDTESDWGFVDYTFCPRFAWSALGAFLHVMAGARYVRTLDLPEPLHALQFRRGDEAIMAVFHTEGERPTTITGRWRSASVIDPMGNTSTSTGAGRIQFLADALPSYLVLRGLTQDPPLIS